MNVLIAEDSSHTREVLKNILLYNIDNSTVIFEAENGEVALDIMKNNPIDILLTDIMMPSMNGFELIKQMKEDEFLNHIFIAVITALTADDEVKKLFALGADYYISKPIQQDDIVARLKLIYRLVETKEPSSLEFIRDTFHPCKSEIAMHYSTVFTILKEDDFYQIIHHLFELYPRIDKIVLKDFIIFLLKSYKTISDKYKGSFEIILESSSTKEVYLSCNYFNLIDSIKNFQKDIPSSYTLEYTEDGLKIKIPTQGE